MFTHAQQRVIKVTLDNIPPYDVLKCRTTSNLTGNTEYLGDYQANTNSWLYQIPDSILDQAQYFQFFGKRNDLPEIKFMHPCFRVIADKDSVIRHLIDNSFIEADDDMLKKLRHNHL